MERVYMFLKKYWWQCSLGGIFIIVIAPYITELIIKKGLYRPDTFDENTWFSFMGSYLGAVITVIIFFVTICMNQISIEDEIKRNRKNAEIEREIEKVKYIYNFFTLRDYRLQDLEIEKAEFRRLLSDLIIVKTYLEYVECKENPDNEFEKSRKDFYDCVITENFLLQFDIGHKMENLSDDNNSRVNEISELIFEITQKRNLYIREMTNRYEAYLDNLFMQMY